MDRIEHNLFDAGNLEKFIVGFLGDRLAAMGETESGLHDYYRRYFWEKRKGYAPRDRPVAKFLRAMNRRFSRSIEVGAGVGQLSALLAASGFDAFAIERETRRAAAAGDLFARVVAADPRSTGRLHAVHDAFPSTAIATPDRRAVAIFTNIMVSDCDDVEEMIIGGLGGVVMDLARLSRSRTSVAQWEALAARVMDEGYGPPQEVLSVGEPDRGDPPPREMCRIVFFPAKVSQRLRTGRIAAHSP
jgi:hypothetical protein